MLNDSIVLRLEGVKAALLGCWCRDDDDDVEEERKRGNQAHRLHHRRLPSYIAIIVTVARALPGIGCPGREASAHQGSSLWLLVLCTTTTNPLVCSSSAKRETSEVSCPACRAFGGDNENDCQGGKERAGIFSSLILTFKVRSPFTLPVIVLVLSEII